MAKQEEGVWRTIRGRRVFIRKGEDLESAMKRSGKFSEEDKKEEKMKKEFAEQIADYIDYQDMENGISFNEQFDEAVEMVAQEIETDDEYEYFIDNVDDVIKKEVKKIIYG